MANSTVEYSAPLGFRLLWALCCPLFLAGAIFPWFQAHAFESFGRPIVYIGLFLSLASGGTIGCLFFYYSMRFVKLTANASSITQRTSVLYWRTSRHIEFDRIYFVHYPINDKNGRLTIFLRTPTSRVRLANQQDCSKLDELMDWLRDNFGDVKIVDRANRKPVER